VEVANPGHPFGVRGVSEANIIPPPAAIANAIYGAAQVRMRRLPMNPPAIMDRAWPGVCERLLDVGRLRPNISVAVDGEVSPMGLIEKGRAGQRGSFCGGDQGRVTAALP
jgi:hypothetical protein